jgi:hypothetical protein
VSFATMTLCVTSQRVFIFVSIYFIIDSVRKLLDTPSYILSPFGKSVQFLLQTKNRVNTLILPECLNELRTGLRPPVSVIFGYFRTLTLRAVMGLGTHVNSNSLQTFMTQETPSLKMLLTHDMAGPLPEDWCKYQEVIGHKVLSQITYFRRIFTAPLIHCV